TVPATASGDGPAPAGKLSPIELMRQKAAMKGTAPVAEAAPASQIKAAPVRATTPATAPPVPVAPSVRVLAPATAEEKRVLWDFYVTQVRPYLMERGSGGLVGRSQLATAMSLHRVFHSQESILPAVLHPVLNELREACETRRQLEHQRTLLRWMHWWLMLHVPVSVLLLVFLAAHVLMALRVVPLEF
ncbi:MAG: hypothetical protein RL215_2999, partial [Planctomycetota bacterium]